MTSTHEMAFFHSNFMLQTTHEDDLNQPSTSLAPILPSCMTHEFHGEASLLRKRSPMTYSTGFDMCEEVNNNHGDHDLSDDGSQLGEKKRRLNMEQVKTLEKNFELGNKLEPERKMQLARALGLQPRQVAIWFQNRRARWKTKQLETDYEILKRQFDAVKAENDSLQAQNQRFHAEILALKNREPTESINLNKETEGSSSNRSENSSEIKLEISRIDSSRPMFPSSLTMPNGIAQQFFHKMDQTVKEESLCNMFNGIDDQTGFWPWLEQPHFN